MRLNPSTPEFAASAQERASLRQGAQPEHWPRAWGPPAVSGRMRVQPEDFIVSESLPFELSGAGEHLYLKLRKTGQNTRWVARQLAAAAGLKPLAVGFAGLKDRHAVTEQWFSLYLPGRPDPALPDMPGVEILAAMRHTGKLRTGAVAGNHFRLTLRDLRGDISGLPARLEQIREQGLPNYFGSQRFGHDAANLDLLSQPGAWRQREARSFGLSALRSALFNGYLASRIDDGSWTRRLSGEVVARGDERLPASGLLWGVGPNHNEQLALARDEAWFGAFPATTALLEAAEVRMMRRALGVRPADLTWRSQADTLVLEFSLPKGAYATSLLREAGDFENAATAGEEFGAAGD